MTGLEDILKPFTKEPEIPTEELVEPTDYGNGVMYFPCIREQFAKSLSVWIGKHPQSAVCAIANNFYIPNNVSTTIEPTGYVVVVRRVR